MVHCRLRRSPRRTLAVLALTVAIVLGARIEIAGRVQAATEALYPGWNTIVYDGPSLPPDAAFASIRGQLAAVFTLTSVDGTAAWLYALPGEGGTLSIVEPGKVYWLQMNAAATYTTPSAPTPTPTPARTATPAAAPGGAEGWRGVEEGLATWYGYELAGNRTACGDIFDPQLLTAASNTLPCGTVARVTNTNTGLSVVVKINDRGGFRPPLIIDLSKAAYETIAVPGSGNVPVVIEIR